MFKNPFSFAGRINRAEYALSYLICMVLFIMFLIIFNIAARTSDLVLIISLMGLIPYLWFMCSQCVKRCHDRGKSGWWILVPFYSIILLFLEGEPGENRYDKNPQVQKEDPFF